MVDHHAARRHFLDDPLTNALRLGEQIGGQRLGPRVHETDCVVQGLDGHDRQDRAEDLVCHQRLGRIGIDHDGRLNADARRVRATADDDVALGRGERGGEPVEVALVHDALSARVLGLERRDRLFDLVDELIADLRIGQHVVRRDADLAGVDQLGPRDALGGHVEVRVRGHDDRALTAQLQGDGRQVRRRSLVDLAADLGAAGETDVIEALRDELLAAPSVALDDGDRVVVQVAAERVRPSAPTTPGTPPRASSAPCCPRRWPRRRVRASTRRGSSMHR